MVSPRVIARTKRGEANYYSMYLNAYRNTLNNHEGDMYDKDLLKKLIFLCVKIIINKPKPANYQEAHSEFELYYTLKIMMQALTPKEFMNIFPIKKEYDGHKYGAKDYFYTMDHLKTIDCDKPIEDADDFMWYYWNDDIHDLNVNMMMNLSYLRQMQGEPSLAEEWASENEIPMYTKHEDAAGNEYLLDEYGKTIKVNKPRPKHLRLVH